MIILIAILAAFFFIIGFNFWIKRQKSNSKAMNEFSEKIRIGAKTFLFTEYKILSIFILAITFLIAFFNYLFSLTFFFGAFFSLIVGRIGMNAATRANILTAEASKKDAKSGLKVAYLSGLKASISAMLIGMLVILF